MTHCIAHMVEKEETTLLDDDNDNKEITLLNELEQDNYQIKKEVLEIDARFFPDTMKIKENVLRQAYNMDKLIEYYPQHYPYTKNSIFSAIINEYKRMSVSQPTLDIIYRAFAFPEFDKYKTHIYNTAKRRRQIPDTDEEANALENSTPEKQVIDSQTLENIEFMRNNIDNPKIKEFIQQAAKDMLKDESKQKKELEDEEKITIPTPEWLEPETEEERPSWVPAGIKGRLSKTAQAAYNLSQAWLDIAIRIYRYPPEKEEDDIFYSEGIETMHALIVPGTDLKYVRDTLSYLDITYEKETQSIHSAMSKSKILTPSGKYRKVTREQIADIGPQMLLLAIHIIERFPGFIKFCIYLIREQKPHSGEFHLNRHEKLSESAFGKSSLMD